MMRVLNLGARMGICKNCGCETSHGKCGSCGEEKKGILSKIASIGRNKKDKKKPSVLTAFEDQNLPQWRKIKLTRHETLGWGIVLKAGPKNKGAIVDVVCASGPARESGLIREGDHLKCIQDVDCTELPYPSIAKLFAELGSAVELEVFNSQEDPSEPDDTPDAAPPSVSPTTPVESPFKQESPERNTALQDGYVQVLNNPINTAVRDEVKRLADQMSNASTRPSLASTVGSASTPSVQIPTPFEDVDEKLRERNRNIGYITENEIASKPGVAAPRLVPAQTVSGSGDATPQPEAEPHNGHAAAESAAPRVSTPQPPSLTNEGRFFIGAATPETAGAILMQPTHGDGAYLVRESLRSKGEYVISVKYANDVKHIPITYTAEGHRISKSIAFPTIPELIKHYQDCSLNKHFSALATVLAEPCGTIDFQ